MRIIFLLLLFVGGTIWTCITGNWLYIIFIAIWFPFFMYYLVLYIDYRGQFDVKIPKLTFKQFYTIYCVNPNKWKLYSDYVKYNETSTDFINFENYIKYRRFYKKREKNEIKSAQFKNQADLIVQISKDLEKERQKAEEVIKRGKICDADE